MNLMFQCRMNIALGVENMVRFIHQKLVYMPVCFVKLAYFYKLCSALFFIIKYTDNYYTYILDVPITNNHKLYINYFKTIDKIIPNIIVSTQKWYFLAIEKRLKLCEEGKNANDMEDDEMEEERAISYVNSRMTFGLCQLLEISDRWLLMEKN